MKRRPLILIAISYLAGILCDYLLTAYWPEYTIVVIIVLITVFIPLIFYYKNLKDVAIIVIVVLAGLIYHNYRSYTPEDNIIKFVKAEKTLVKLHGIIVKPPVMRRTLNYMPFFENVKNKPQTVKAIFLLRVENFFSTLGCQKVSGHIKVIVYTKSSQLKSQDIVKLQYGDEVEIVGNLFVPAEPTNPCQFDYRRYLRRYEPPVTAIMRTRNFGNLRLMSRHNGNLIYGFVNSLRREFKNIIYSVSSKRDAPIISSLLLGDREAVPGTIKEDFVNTGTIHFMAISGLHIGILVFSVHMLLKLIGLRSKSIAAIVILFVIVYAMLTGMKPPVLRAGIMVAVYYGAVILNRRWDSCSGISAAVILVLLRNPDDLFSVSFQLSFIALIGIITLSPKIELLLRSRPGLEELLTNNLRLKIMRFLKNYCVKSISISLAAWLSVLPIVAFYFHIIAPVSIVLNIVMFPLIWLILVSGFALLMFSGVWDILAFPFACIASFSDSLILKIISLLNISNVTFFYLSGPDFFWIVVYYLMGFLLICQKRFNVTHKRLILIFISTFAVYTFTNYYSVKKSELKATCFDVGHGMAILVEFPNGKNMLYDIGTWSNYDVGKGVLAPFLWKENIGSLDACFLSHRDLDHCNGLPSILERFEVRKLFVSQIFLDSKIGELLIDYTEKLGVKSSIVKAGTKIREFGDVSVTVLNPPESNALIPKLTVNDSSCVLKIEYAGYAILFCADITEEGVNLIVSHSGNDLRSDVIIVPHHGGFITNTEKLIKYVKPEYAIISAKTTDLSTETVDAYKRHGVKVHKTCDSGAIIMIVSDSGITVSSYKESGLPGL